MASQGASATNFDFNDMDFSGFSMPQTSYNGVKNGVIDNTFFADEGIDTTESFGQQPFDSMFLPNAATTGMDMNSTDFGMQQPLALDNTSGSASWGNTFPPTPAQSFGTMYTPQLNATALGKRPLQLDVQDFPQAKRHEGLGGSVDLGFSPYPTSASITGSSWTVDTLPTPSSTNDMIVGISDHAADMCATWFGKYNILPTDKHIESLSQLTGEPASAIRQWFGQALKQGFGHDSAYKSQTSGFTQDPLFPHTSPSTSDLIEQPTIPDLSCFHDTQVQTTATSSQAPPRGGKKGCNPTDDLSLLARDPKKIYQCTRKCGKRYGRKCDWKRNEEEGYPSKSWVCSLCVEQNTERVKPSFRKYHFSQHFRNVHPGLDCNDYEEASVVHNDTAFPRRCGFCPHRFVSRQDRIDHIAEHFKEGKCMLDWNDGDSNDLDNTDDDDDNDGRPDGGDYTDFQPFYPPGNDFQGGSDSSKSNGSGSSGQQHPQNDGFFQFHLQQFNNGSNGGASCDSGQPIRPEPQVPGDQRGDNISFEQYIDIDGGAGGATSCAKQHINEALRASCDEQRFAGGQQGETPRDESSSIHGKPQTTTGVDSQSLARDAVSQSLTSHQKNGTDSANAVLTSVDIRKMIKLIQKSEMLQSLLIEHGRSRGGEGGEGGRGAITLVRMMNALLALLSPSQRQPPILPPPLSPPDTDIADVLISKALVSSPSLCSKTGCSPEGELFAKDSCFNLTSDPNVTLQQYWQGLSTLIDQGSFLSIKLLGTGGFSTVDEVIHRSTSLRVSRKTLKNRQQSALSELNKEVKTLQKLRHPHIIRLIGAYSQGDKVSILLSPVAETTLAVWLDRNSVTRSDGLANTIVKMLGCLSSTIRYLHEQRPVVKHMDIKPQNILVMQGSQEFPHVVLSDFGISSTEENTSLDGNGKHTPLTRQYSAPEVSEGISREMASDIWSLGCVFAEMATVAFSHDDEQWREFRSQFLGRNANYYCQDIPALQAWLTQFLEEPEASLQELTVVSTVKSMLNAEPSDRPDAAMLTMVFTPAPCCLSWPNEQVSFPGPREEMQTLESLTHEEDGCCRAQFQFGDLVDKNVQSTDVTLDTLSIIPPAGKETFSSAKKWLHECSHGHSACEYHHKPLSKDLPTRLVDIRTDKSEGIGCIRIVNTAQLPASQESITYAALSYPWSQEDFTLTTSHTPGDPVPSDKLSSALNDAIQAASRTGYDYIWTDSLCVVQDSPADKQRECRAMASTFRNADLTIAQVDTTSPLQPIPTPIDHNKSDSRRRRSNRRCSDNPLTLLSPTEAVSRPLDYNWDAWDTRPWVLQERLLCRRLLHFGAEQLYWECNSLKASETFPQGLPPLLWEKVHMKTTSTSTSAASLDGRAEMPSGGFGRAGRAEGARSLCRSGDVIGGGDSDGLV
ncbi:hypothetical protein CC80DRAFT_493300 [Byssothecium circinans]|uniref:Protein kinase domain-containing protein n=1 Tax=Byssothecium circinans TaxID=147558 RepID=A0A6A5TUI4_9PLEO|nr:hypothetical protein CC80DRAFT_493300 [Byssothecium circinans]